MRHGREQDSYRREQPHWAEALLGCGILYVIGFVLTLIVRIVEGVIRGLIAGFRYLLGRRAAADGVAADGSGRPAGLEPILILFGIACTVIFCVVVAFVIVIWLSPTPQPAQSVGAGPPIIQPTPVTPSEPPQTSQQPVSDSSQSGTSRIQVAELTTETVTVPAPTERDPSPITAHPLNPEVFLLRWASALTDGSETSLAQVYAPQVDYEGIRRRKLSSIADKQISVHRLMPGVRYDLESFRTVESTEDRYVIEAAIRVSGSDPNVRRRMTRRLVLERDGQRLVIVQEDLAPHG